MALLARAGRAGAALESTDSAAGHHESHFGNERGADDGGAHFDHVFEDDGLVGDFVEAVGVSGRTVGVSGNGTRFVFTIVQIRNFAGGGRRKKKSEDSDTV
jgi:hypothetical protein